MHGLQLSFLWVLLTLLCGCSKGESRINDSLADTGIRVGAPVRTEGGQSRVTWRWTVNVPSQVSHLITSPFNWYVETAPPEYSPGQGRRQTFAITLTVDGQEREEGYLLRYRMDHHNVNGGVNGSVGKCEIVPEGFRIDRLVAVSQAEQSLQEGEAAILATVDGNTVMLHARGMPDPPFEGGLRSPWHERFLERAYKADEQWVFWRDEN